VIGVCTDNAANMKKAWKLLNKDYPGLECYGCVAHGLNLIFSDGLKIPFISNIIAKCTEIIKVIKNSYLLLAKFREKQRQMKSQGTLKLPIKTRCVIIYSFPGSIICSV